jgi:hypothetical protein
MLAPNFARRLLAHKVGEKTGTIGSGLKTRFAGANVGAIAMLFRLLETRAGGAAGIVLTEEKARRLASKLLARADQLARTATPKHRAPSADERP